MSKLAADEHAAAMPDDALAAEPSQDSVHVDLFVDSTQDSWQDEHGALGILPILQAPTGVVGKPRGTTAASVVSLQWG